MIQTMLLYLVSPLAHIIIAVLINPPPVAQKREVFTTRPIREQAVIAAQNWIALTVLQTKTIVIINLILP